MKSSKRKILITDNDIDILLELIYAKLNAKMGTLALNK